jgi:cytochrome P450
MTRVTHTPAGPKSFGALKHLLRFRNAPMDFMHEMKVSYGDLVRLRIGPKLFYFSFSPQHAKHLLTDFPSNYPKSPLVFQEIIPITGKTGLVQLSGEKWSRMRRLTNPAFQPAMLERYIPLILQCTDEFISRLKSGKPGVQKLDVSETMTHLILTTASRLFFGVDIEPGIS